jgi:hypothetical protein
MLSKFFDDLFFNRKIIMAGELISISVASMNQALRGTFKLMVEGREVICKMASVFVNRCLTCRYSDKRKPGTV